MAGGGGRQGLLVDIDTGVLRKDRVLVQHVPGTVLFLGIGARADRLRRFAFGEAAAPDPFIARCREVAEAAEGGRLAKGRRLGVPRAVLHLRDPVLRRFLIAEALAKAGYDPDEPRDAHGRWTSDGGDSARPQPPAPHEDSGSRAGPPLPVRHEESRGSAGPLLLAQNEDDETEATDASPDFGGPARQALWDDAIARLRRIDPGNPNLTYFANPDTAPSQAALDRLVSALKTATARRRILDKVMPGGVPIGARGSGSKIRELPGGLSAAQELFDYLRVGGTVRRSDAKLTIIELPDEAGFITLRPVSGSGDPAVEVNLGRKIFLKLHFPQGQTR